MLIKSRYRNYILVQLLVVVFVILIFKVMPEKQPASVVASFLFIGSALGVLRYEFKFPNPYRRFSVWAVIIFLTVSAIPIFLLRIFNWGVDFNELTLLGLTGAQMHKVSNYFFILMLIGFFIDSYLLVLKEKSRDT